MCSFKKLKVSVIMPVYNRERTIEQAIQSILDQTYPYFELVIVDDASTDDTIEIIRSFQDSRIRLIENSMTTGASSARNTGVKHAKYEWIAFHDSDDIWLPDKLKLQLQMLEKKLDPANNLPIIYTGFYRYRNSKKEYIPGKHVKSRNGYIHKELLKGNFISTQTVLLSKKTFENIGGFAEDMPRFQDWELWLRIACDHPFYYVDQPLVEVHFSEDSISAEHEKLIQAYEKIMEKHERMFQKAGSSYYGGLLFSYGHNLCLGGQMQKGRGYLKLSLKYSPKLIKNIISYIASLFGSNFYRIVYMLYSR